MKTPPFWYRKEDSPAPAAEILLSPLSWIYDIGHRLNQKLKKPHTSQIPVICIGNAVAGGSGKTPAALALMALLQEEKLFQNPCFLSRGYGGSLKGPVAVNPAMPTAECGDEPLLLAQDGPAIIARNRAAGADFCAAQGHDAILLDDGLQNAGLRKDLSFLVIDGASGFGNGKTLPAGPLRENLEDAFAKTDAFILIGRDERGATARLPTNKPLFQAHIHPRLPAGLDKTMPLLAFAGLGRPEKFYRMLHGLGFDVKGWEAFPDHHPYTQADLDRLREKARNLGAELITTDKDAVRLRGLMGGESVKASGITLALENPAAMLGFIREKLLSSRPL